MMHLAVQHQVKNHSMLFKQCFPFFRSSDNTEHAQVCLTEQRQRNFASQFTEGVKINFVDNHEFYLHHFPTPGKKAFPLPPGFCISQGNMLDGSSLSLGLREQLIASPFGS